MGLVQKSLVQQNINTGSLMYKCIERVLKGGANFDLPQKANLGGYCTVDNFISVTAKITRHIFSTYAYCDQYLKRYS